MNTVPYGYQIECARQLHRMDGRGIVVATMGLGKSLIALMYAHRHPQLRPIVIVCPASLKYNWNHECISHFGMKAEILEGTKPPKGGIRLKENLVILNYDILRPWMDYLKALNPKLVIVDESHFLGNKQSLRTRMVRTLCQNVPHVIALSGTPLTNRPSELWPTLNILRPERFPSFFQFAMRFCAPKRVPWGGGWDFSGASNLDELHHLLIHGKNGEGGVMIRKRKEDVIHQLPSKQRIVVPLVIPNRKEYDEAVQDFLNWLAKKDLGRARRAARAEGLVKLGELKRMVGELKKPLVAEWIDNFFQENDGKLIAFAVHRKIVEFLQERYENTSVKVYGSLTSKQRHLAVTKFQKDKKTRLFVGNIKAAGVGLNLTAADSVCFTELEWTPGTHAQAEDRCYARLNDMHGATIFYLIAQDTIESHLLQVIQSKQKTSSAILDGKGKGDSLDVYDILCSELLKERRKGKKS